MTHPKAFKTALFSVCFFLHLVVVGDDDLFCDKVSQADRIVKNIPSSTEIVVKDAGHFRWVEQPTQFFSECIARLKKQDLKENK